MSTTRPPQTQHGGKRTLGPEGEDDGSDSQQLSRGEIFEMLSSNRRRYVLHHLKRKRGPADLGELAERVGSWENAKPVEAVRAKRRENV